jgi:hypothetical protein
MRDWGPGWSGYPGWQGSQRPTVRLGLRAGLAIICTVVAMSVAVAVVWVPLVSHLVDDSGPHVQSDASAIPVAAYWVEREVTLTTAEPSAMLEVVFDYSGPVGGSLQPSIVVTTPTDAPASGGSQPTVNPAFGLADPVVRVDFLMASGERGACGAPCERPLDAAACFSTCTQTEHVRLTLQDPAGRGAVRLKLRAGATAPAGLPLPAKFQVRIQPVDVSAGPSGGG